jgi:DNA-binding PadR family transcriptional regulator
MQSHVFHILLSLVDGEQHGYGVIKDITRRTNGELILGTSTLYAAIKRLLREGLIEKTARPREADSDDPRRRYYRATAFGRAVAREEALRIRRLDRIIAKTALLEKAP